MIHVHKIQSQLSNWILSVLVLCSFLGCASTGFDSFKQVSDASNQFTVRVFDRTSFLKSAESVIESEAISFAKENGYSSYEILGYSNDDGYALDSQGGVFFSMLMGVRSEPFRLYTVQFKR
jgi:hypothetical protein